jgi:hypothetical protein
MSKSQAHTRYRNKAGNIVPGVTTMTALLAKPALIKWANNLGLQGIDSSKYVDDKADIGTLAHYMIEMHLLGQEPDFGNYTPNQQTTATNAFKKYLTWEAQSNLKVLHVELRLVSEEHQFGGTCDLYCELNGRKTLIDFKTSKAIYSEMFTQVSAYEALLVENGYPVEDVKILRIGRDETEGFDCLSVPNRVLHFQKFLCCRRIYDINYQLKGE